MINKILDNYFTDKLLEEIKWSFIVRGLNYRFLDDKRYIDVEAKPRKYDKEFYSKIIQIRKEDSFKYMCDLDNFIKQVDKIINDYQKEL